jgi:nicotinate-nucleotide adenylyltransferase
MPVWYLVPDGVVQYIEKRGLYHGDRSRPGGLLPGTGVRLRGTPDDDHRSTNGPSRASLPDDPAPGDGTSPDLQEMPR